jgi:GNAT superfamily N-acetyltransferase
MDKHPPAVSLRPSTAEDLGFLMRLHEAAMWRYVEQTYGHWNASLQRRSFLERTRPEAHEIVELDGRPIGCLKVRVTDNTLHLDRVFLLPEVQRRGIGTALVRGVIARARSRSLPVRLRVFPVNPARRLYERLGFRQTHSTGTHLYMELPPPTLRPARPSEAERLTELVWASKRHWGYPDSLMELWRDQLRITPQTLQEREALVAEQAGRVVGMAALVDRGSEAELTDLWVEPAQIGSGLGRVLFEHAVGLARHRRAETLVAVSDPNAEGFYLRMGARREGTVASMPQGRRLPRMVWEL